METNGHHDCRTGLLLLSLFFSFHGLSLKEVDQDR